MPSKTTSKPINKPKPTAKPTPHAAQFLIGMRVQHTRASNLQGEINSLTPDNAQAYVKWDNGHADDYSTDLITPISR